MEKTQQPENKFDIIPGYMDILLSVHFPEALHKLLQFGVHNQNASLLASGFFSTFHFCYIVHTLPENTQVLSVHPLRSGTIYIFPSHRMTEPVDSARAWEVSLETIESTLLFKAEPTRAILYPMLGIPFVR